MVFLAILAGLALGAACAFGAGLGAAFLLEATHGSREGAAAMQGFFVFGPAGGVAGLLLGVALVLRYGGVSVAWSNRLMIAAACVFALGAVVLAWAAMPADQRRAPPRVLVFELEMDEPMLGPGPFEQAARWSYNYASVPEETISSFFEKRCESGRCVVRGSSEVPYPTTGARIVVDIGKTRYRFPVPLPAVIDKPIEWSSSETSAGMRFRYRVDVKAD